MARVVGRLIVPPQGLRSTTKWLLESPLAAVELGDNQTEPPRYEGVQGNQTNCAYKSSCGWLLADCIEQPIPGRPDDFSD